MESCLHIGAKVDKDTSTAMASAICAIFQEGHATHQEQDTIQRAIDSLTRVLEVKNVTVTGSTFVGEKKVIVEAEA